MQTGTNKPVDKLTGPQIVAKIRPCLCNVAAPQATVVRWRQTDGVAKESGDNHAPNSTYRSHFAGSATVRDIVIGMANGLTVPFSLATRLSGAVNSTAIIVTAGLAEIAAGSIAMGLGRYLAARSDTELYASVRSREQYEVDTLPDIEKGEVVQILEIYGVDAEQSALIANALRQQAWIDFIIRFELASENQSPSAPSPRRKQRPAPSRPNCSHCYTR